MADEKPKHKPSPKRTLEEVLKSLQDLIRNDLVSRRDANAAPPEPPPTPPAGSIPDAFDEALDKLDRLITHELVEPAEQARAAPRPGPEEPLPEETEWPPEENALEERVADDLLPGPNAGGTEATAESGGEQRTRLGADESRFGIQDTLPFEEPPPSLASFLKDAEPEERAHEAAPPDAPILDEPTLEAEDQSSQDEGTTRKIEAEKAPRETRSPPPREGTPSLTLDDGIPVLSEIAEIEPGHEPPTPEQLRNIAIRVVARLNIERRKAGEPPLDIRTIERLQQLLKEALAGGRPRDD